MKTVILCGGKGSRMQEETSIRPKPMVEIGGVPILWHIMKYYESFKLEEFVLALGYKGDFIKQYFLNYNALNSDFQISLRDGEISYRKSRQEKWNVHLIDTGAETDSGGRLLRLQPVLGNETFLLTYGDGLANIDLRKLLDFHKAHGKLVSVTAVRPSARFGELQIGEKGAVNSFKEKPQTAESWINGGFFVMNPGVFEYIQGDQTKLERDTLEAIARDGQLMAYRHEGFWQCMDTLRDRTLLEDAWAAGSAPWKVWQT